MAIELKIEQQLLRNGSLLKADSIIKSNDN